MQESSLKPLTLKITKAMLNTIGEQGVSLGHNFFNGDIRIGGIFGDTQMQLMGLAKNRLTEWGYSHDGLEDFLLQIAHEGDVNPIAEEVFELAIWDRKDRLHSQFIDIMGISKPENRTDEPKDIKDYAAREAAIEATRETVFMKKWLHQTLALGLNEDYNPCGAAGILVFYGKQDVTPLLEKLSLNPNKLLGKKVCVNVKDQSSFHQALSTWITELDGLYPEARSFFKAKQDTYRPFLAKTDLLKARRTSFCVNFSSYPNIPSMSSSMSFYWPVCTDYIDMEQVKALDKEWFHQLWMQVYEELYVPNPKGYTLTARPDQENSALKFFGTQVRWREDDEDPIKKTVVYQAYLDWCSKAPKDRIVMSIDRFFINVIRHLREFGFKDIETEDKLCLKEFTTV